MRDSKPSCPNPASPRRIEPALQSHFISRLKVRCKWPSYRWGRRDDGRLVRVAKAVFKDQPGPFTDEGTHGIDPASVALGEVASLDVAFFIEQAPLADAERRSR